MKEGKGKDGSFEWCCCMCGDHGLSSQLFTCKNCRFRSQHKYCSNLYPEAKSYSICNWCLTRKDYASKPKAQGNSNINSSGRTSFPTTSSYGQIIKKSKMKRVFRHEEDDDDDHGDIDLKDVKRPAISKHIIKNMGTNEFQADEPSPSSGGRKRATTDVGIAKRIITRSQEIMSNNGRMLVRKVIRNNKVRRYKLLNEVKS